MLQTVDLFENELIEFASTCLKNMPALETMTLTRAKIGLKPDNYEKDFEYDSENTAIMYLIDFVYKNKRSFEFIIEDFDPEMLHSVQYNKISDTITRFRGVCALQGVSCHRMIDNDTFVLTVKTQNRNHFQTDKYSSLVIRCVKRLK
jgi:hypothetical protein